MYQNVTHANYIVPFNFWVIVSEIMSQFISGLPYYLNTVYQGVAMQFVMLKFLETDLICKRGSIIYCRQNMLQSPFISYWLSHISVFCHGLQIQQRMATTCRQPPCQPLCLVFS